MLSATSVDLTFDDDEPEWKSRGTFVYKAASANSWGVTCIGRGFNWTQQREENDYSKELLELDLPVPHLAGHNHPHLVTIDTITPTPSEMFRTTIFTSEPVPLSPSRSLSASPRPTSPSIGPYPCYGRHAASSAPSSPAPRRRSSQQRVSLIAGRVSIAPIEPPSTMLAPSFCHSESGIVGTNTGPTPCPERESYLGNRSISEFSIDGEIGRGAYGLVKRGREIQADGSLGVRDHN
jgi:protein-serine/threonine kinase